MSHPLVARTTNRSGVRRFSIPNDIIRVCLAMLENLDFGTFLPNSFAIRLTPAQVLRLKLKRPTKAQRTVAMAVN